MDHDLLCSLVKDSDGPPLPPQPPELVSPVTPDPPDTDPGTDPCPPGFGMGANIPSTFGTGFIGPIPSHCEPPIPGGPDPCPTAWSQQSIQIDACDPITIYSCVSFCDGTTVCIPERTILPCGIV